LTKIVVAKGSRMGPKDKLILKLWLFSVCHLAAFAIETFHDKL